MSNEDTFIFKPEEPGKREPERKVPEKEKVSRTEVDEFTIARKTIEYEDDDSQKSYTLPIIASILGVLLVIAIAVLIIVIAGGNDDNEPSPAPSEKIEIPADEPDEEEEEEENAPVLNSYTLVYNGGDIFELESGGYSVVFDVYGDDGEKTGTKKLYIKDSTEITEMNESGNIGNIAPKFFVKRIQEQGEDMLVLNCTVNEDENLLISIEYDGVEETEEIPEEETPEEETDPGESGFTDDPSPEEEEAPTEEEPSISQE